MSDVYYLVHNSVVMLFKLGDHISFFKLVILVSKNRNAFSLIIMLDSCVFLLKKLGIKWRLKGEGMFKHLSVSGQLSFPYVNNSF